MENDVLHKLIDHLGNNEIISILKRSKIDDNHFQISGFARMENVPPCVLKGQLNRSQKLARRFLISTVKEFVTDASIFEEKEVESIKKKVNSQNQLGIAAHCLLQNTQDFQLLGKDLIDGYISVEKPKEIIRTVKNTDSIEKEKKKTEKYKQKWSEQKREIDSVKQEVLKLRNEVNSLKQEKNDLEKEIIALKCENDELNLCLEKKEKETIIRKEEHRASPKKSMEPKFNRNKSKDSLLKILAIGCANFLEKYSENFDITALKDEQNIDEISFDQYDEVWIVCSNLSFSTVRKINYLQTCFDEKIQIFPNFRKMNDYINEFFFRS